MLQGSCGRLCPHHIAQNRILSIDPDQVRWRCKPRLQYPQIDPVAIAIGPVQIHWYGLMYVVGFVAAWHRFLRIKLSCTLDLIDSQ
tara:strand:+ start:921 stop:1178 length:258 start_codon:yes stop_codon:yes gene_type:complete